MGSDTFCLWTATCRVAGPGVVVLLLSTTLAVVTRHLPSTSACRYKQVKTLSRAPLPLPARLAHVQGPPWLRPPTAPCNLARWLLPTTMMHAFTVAHSMRLPTTHPGHTKQNGIVVHLIKPVVRQQNARMCINIRPWILGLASLQNDSHQLFYGTDDEY